MLTGHDGSLRLPRRRCHLLVAFVSCLRPVFIPVTPSRAPNPLLPNPRPWRPQSGPFALHLSTARTDPL